MLSGSLKQRERVEAIIDFFELEPYRKRLVGDLPYGIQKLIGLARAFAASSRAWSCSICAIKRG